MITLYLSEGGERDRFRLESELHQIYRPVVRMAGITSSFSRVLSTWPPVLPGARDTKIPKPESLGGETHTPARGTHMNDRPPRGSLGHRHM